MKEKIKRYWNYFKVISIPIFIGAAFLLVVIGGASLICLYPYVFGVIAAAVCLTAVVYFIGLALIALIPSLMVWFDEVFDE